MSATTTTITTTMEEKVESEDSTEKVGSEDSMEEEGEGLTDNVKEGRREQNE